ncbi:hypothetical protein C2W62_38345 [Candidatus Entotheonella serta]|nr:hypothetical protein C2W62_38345 [Candidatus Entotheonella serta]
MSPYSPLFPSSLHRYSGQEDIVVGTPVAGRNRVETEPLIGLFINTVVLRVDVSGDPSYPSYRRMSGIRSWMRFRTRTHPLNNSLTCYSRSATSATPPCSKYCLPIKTAPGRRSRFPA